MGANVFMDKLQQVNADANGLGGNNVGPQFMHNCETIFDYNEIHAVHSLLAICEQFIVSTASSAGQIARYLSWTLEDATLFKN